MMDRVGVQLGAYRLVQKLGEGKTGEVYLGEHTSIKTPVAIRLLPTTGAPEERERLLEAARQIADLDHPHLLRLLDYFIQDELLVLVLRHTPWANLLHYHPKGTPLPVERILPYVQDCAAALHYLHDRGLLHLDVKPENMLLGPQAEVWLSNVGLGTLLQPRTRDGRPAGFLGTPLYAAPEQFQGEASPASDQYALAMSVYFWLAGALPWKGDLAALAAQKRRGPPSLREHMARSMPGAEEAAWYTPSPEFEKKLREMRPSWMNKDIPWKDDLDDKIFSIRVGPEQPPELTPAVEEVVLRALAPTPIDRFESVSAFAQALARASHPPLPLSPPGTRLLVYHDHSAVHRVAWSPNGRQIVSVSLGNTVPVWDATIGRTITTCSLPSSTWATAVAWSPDGRRLVIGSGNGPVEVWAVAPGQRLLSYAGHSGFVRAIEWSPNGRLIASSSDDKTAQVWEVETGKSVLLYRGHSHMVGALAWSPDGRRIASAGEEKTAQGWDGVIHVWDAQTGELLLTCRGHRHAIPMLAWSPDGRRFASAGVDGIVRLWDALTGECLLTYTGHTHSVMSLAWSPDGRRIVSGGSTKGCPRLGGRTPQKGLIRWCRYGTL
jgi:serine/threonine protein kinase